MASNAPFLLGGKPAVRVHIRYKNDRGLPIERVTVALVDAKGQLPLGTSPGDRLYPARIG